MLDQVQKFVTESFGEENRHLVRTLHWMRELLPQAPEEMLIAAVSHDIERAFNEEAKTMNSFRTGDGQREHEEEGGRIMYEFLTKEGYAPEKAARVRELIAVHERGGDAEQDLLKDADSLSWLEVSAPKHISKRKFPKKELARKVISMYERISTPRARELAQPFYEEAVGMLGEWEE